MLTCFASRNKLFEGKHLDTGLGAARAAQATVCGAAIDALLVVMPDARRDTIDLGPALMRSVENHHPPEGELRALQNAAARQTNERIGGKSICLHTLTMSH